MVPVQEVRGHKAAGKHKPGARDEGYCLTSVQGGSAIDVARHEGGFCLFPHGVIPHSSDSALETQPRHEGALEPPTLRDLRPLA